MPFLITEEFDWTHFLDLANNRHRVIGPVFKSLKQVNPPWIPYEAWFQLRKKYKANTISLMKKIRELLNILNTLAKDGIQALPIKGPILGYQIYGDFLTRSCNDLDILLPKTQLLDALIILKSLDYKHIQVYRKTSVKQFEYYLNTAHHILLENKNTGIKVELHWRPFDVKIPSLEFDQLWENRRPLKIGEKTYPVCHPKDMLTLQIIHGEIHNWRRLFWLHDIYLLTANFSSRDWLELDARMKHLGMALGCNTIRQLLNKWYDHSPFGDSEPIFTPNSRSLFLTRLANTFICENDYKFFNKGILPKIKLHLGRLYLSDTISQQAQFLRNVIFPSDFLYINLPDRYFLFYFLFRPYFWFFRWFTDIEPVKKRLD